MYQKVSRDSGLIGKEISVLQKICPAPRPLPPDALAVEGGDNGNAGLPKRGAGPIWGR